jgi:hypothetical protein
MLELGDMNAPAAERAPARVIGVPVGDEQVGTLSFSASRMQLHEVPLAQSASQAVTVNGQEQPCLALESETAALWCGSPVLNAEGRVLGICSRPVAVSQLGEQEPVWYDVAWCRSQPERHQVTAAAF